MPNILIIDSNPSEANAPGAKSPGETYAGALKACRDDLSLTIVRPYDGEAVPELEAFDGVVFTGSSVEWNTDDARAEPLARVMRRVFDQGLPMLGSCNGMQLAASVLGGRSDESPNGAENGLARDIMLTEAGRAHPLLHGREDGYAVPCIHRDEVRKLPDGAVLLAGNAHSGVQAFAYEKDGLRFWGMQYHPEIDPGLMAGIVSRLELLPPDQVRDLEQAEQDPLAAERLGVRPADMRPEVRMTELRNWLASL